MDEAKTDPVCPCGSGLHVEMKAKELNLINEAAVTVGRMRRRRRPIPAAIWAKSVLIGEALKVLRRAGEQ
jgi:hypothetical protein